MDEFTNNLEEQINIKKAELEDYQISQEEKDNVNTNPIKDSLENYQSEFTEENDEPIYDPMEDL
jgi:hypothetical protein